MKPCIYLLSLLIALPLTMSAQGSSDVPAGSPAGAPALVGGGFPAAGSPAGQATVPGSFAAGPVAVPILGYLSYSAALSSMPEYAAAQDSLAHLREAFNAEAQRAEQDFNQKYELFLEGRRDFPRSILLKRQNELEQLMQQNIDFKERSRRELAATEEALMRPVRARLNETIATVARAHGLILVVNTDSNSCPFIEPALSLPLLDEVTAALSSSSPNR